MPSNRKIPPLKGEASASSQGDVKENRKIMPYSKALKPFSRQLRKEMTNAEILLWTKIRRKQIHGIQFLRQKPIEKFILDFYAKDIKLAIEIDGGQHFTTEHIQKDINRDTYLATLGIYTLRFTNLEVLKNCSGVLSKIEQTVLGLTSPRALRARPPSKGEFDS